MALVFPEMYKRAYSELAKLIPWNRADVRGLANQKYSVTLIYPELVAFYLANKD